MRPSHAAPRGVLLKTPNARHQALWRMAGVVGVVLALAVGSALLGAAMPELDPSSQPATGPFSYFPPQ